ncbi:DUF6973 domain-containing protein [Thiocapsa imhoffii]|nr:hypothetical protein [Thiocapsa imhoffii]
MTFSRILFTSVLLLMTLWGSLWGGASMLAPSLIERAVPVVQARLEQAGVGIDDLLVSSIQISPWLTAIELHDLAVRIDLTHRDQRTWSLEVEISRLDLQLTRLLERRGDVQVSGMALQFIEPNPLPDLPFDRFTNAELRVTGLPLADPGQTAEVFRHKLKELFFENKALGDVRFSGDVTLRIDEDEMVAHLYSEPVGEGFRLRFRESDIRDISESKGLALVPEQIEIVSLYPLRAPVILVLTDQARALAKRHEPNDVWLRDALRHVAWSYSLTQTFGPDFAILVTDAQEMRPGNTPDERTMDFHNNAVGRHFAAAQIPFGSLPMRVREDPEIIRHPDEVAHFGADRLLR